MTMAAVRHGRSVRRSKFRHDNGEEIITLDLSKDLKENIKEILIAVTVQTNVCKSKKLGYLNAFVRLLNTVGKDQDLGYSCLEILSCLRVCLFHDAKEVRAATFRVFRHLIHNEDTMDLLHRLHIDYMIIRSIDICLDNEVERIHAIKLIRRLAYLAPHKLSASLIYPLVAIGNDGTRERDRMVRVCLATICELAFLNPELIAECGGMRTMIRAALECHQYPRINESLVCTIIHLLNHPKTRHYIKFNTDLEQLLAPFTDCHYKFSGSDATDGSSGEDKDAHFAASKMSVVTIMRSWPGLIRFCRPDGSGVQSLIGILFLPFKEIRQGIVEILFDLFRLPLPQWTEDFNAALLSVDPSEMKDAWRLTEGFVYDEGCAVLPHMAKIRPNLVENHLALLMMAWIEAGLLEALVEVVISSEEDLFVRTVILLGELLYSASALLPSESSHHTHCLPTLLAVATSNNIPLNQRHQASVAITYLDRIHTMKKRGPVPCSLFLDHIICNTGGRRMPRAKGFHHSRDRKHLYYLYKLSSEEIALQTLKDCQVLNTKDHLVWDWDLVQTVLQFPVEKLKKVDDQNLSKFVKRMTYFFKPTNHLFSRIDSSHKLVEKIALAGCLFVSFLLEHGQDELLKHLTDLLNDVGQCLSEIGTPHLANEAVFSPANVINTCSHYYFLFIGKCSTSISGDKLLEKLGIYQYLLNIVSVASQDSYVKLIVSSLDYSRDGDTRAVLSKALCTATESSRIYCTQFLRVLLRTRIPGFSTWGIELLTTQLYDQSTSVALMALEVLDEACDVEACRNSLIKLRPACLHLGDKGTLLTCRLLCCPLGFKAMMEANFVVAELEKWSKSFNQKYVFMVEELLNEALTTYEKGHEGSFSRRSSQKQPLKEAYLPVHLYGQLTQHREGFELLQQQDCLHDYFDCIRCQDLNTFEDIVALKTALWAVGNLGSSKFGSHLLEEEKLFPEIIKLAEESSVFSVRGTAFYALGLLASTREGAECLAQLGWESCWHSREDPWPVTEDREELMSDSCDIMNESLLSGVSKFDFERSTFLSSPVGSPSSLFFIEETQEDKPFSSENVNDNSKKLFCDQNSNLDTSGSGIVGKSIPALSRSKNMPFESEGLRRYQTLPHKTSPPKYLGEFRSRALSDRSSSFKTRSKTRNRAFSDDTPILLFKDQNGQKQTSSVAKPHPTQSETISENATIDRGVIPEIRIPDEETPDSAEDIKTKGTQDIDITNMICAPMRESSTPIEENPLSDIQQQQSAQDASTKPSSVDKPSATVSRDKKGATSSSSDSSKSSKNRADSFNTDSTTSGVSSCESVPLMGLALEAMSLSPIASSSSLNTLGIKNSQNEALGSEEVIHPSSFMRRSLNLNRVPSVRKKQTSPGYGILSSSRLMDGWSPESAIVYTTSRDAHGYATWRSIKRQRTASSDLESDYGIGNLYDEENNMSSMSRRSSIDSKMSMEAFASTLRLGNVGMSRNASGVSLTDMDSKANNPLGLVPKATLQKKRPHTGAAEFLGLALPVDINMMFEVHEGEDRRTSSFVKKTERQTSIDEAAKGRKISGSSRRVRTLSTKDETSWNHDVSICFICCNKDSNLRPEPDIQDMADADVESDDNLLEESGNVLSKQQKSDRRSRLDSLNELSSATPGSVTSCNSYDSPAKRMSMDSVHGQALIRQELRKYITNLSSSVGIKWSEQALLGLKQKFPTVFQDICYFSEVCHSLSTSSFRLSSRRFIQELFEDFDISQLLENSRQVLEYTSSDVIGTESSQQESLGKLWEDI